MANEEGSREYDSEAYGDYQGSEEYQYHYQGSEVYQYQGSEEYQYHYDGDDYPSYEEDYSEEQVSRENFRCCFNLDWTPSNCASALRGGPVRMKMKA